MLGAGDIFASCFLYKLLRGGQDINQFIEFAHLKTSEIIQHYSNETKYSCSDGRTRK